MGISVIDRGDYDDDRQPNVSVAVSVTVNVSSQPLHQESSYTVSASPPKEEYPPLALVTSQPVPASPNVVMTLDGGNLPSRLEFASEWSSRVPAKEVGRELYDAYSQALSELGGRHSEAYVSSRGWSLSPREQAIMLLESSTWHKYCRVQDELLSDGDYLVRGAATQYSKAVVAIAGNRESIHSITVSPLWHGCAYPNAIEAEVLWCADRIRAMRPKFSAKRDWTRYSDAEIFELHRRHRHQLIGESAY